MSEAAIAAPTTAAATEPAKTAAQVETAPETPTPEAPKAPETPKPPEARKLKLKVNGEEVELEEGEVIRRAQKAEAVERRMEELAKMRKELEEREGKLKAPLTDPRVKELTLKHGWTDDEAAAFLKVQDLYQREQQTPEQRALAAEQKRREELEQRLAAEEKAKADAKTQAETKAFQDKIAKAVPEAAEKFGLPRTPHAGRLVIEHMLSQARAGFDPDPVEAAAAAAATIKSETRAILKGMTGDQLLGTLGPEVVEAVRKHLVAKAKGEPTTPVTPTTPAAPEPQPKAYLSSDEWRARYA